MTIRQELFDNQDIKYKEFQSKLVPTVNPDKIIGVRVPVLRKIAKRLADKNPSFPIYYYEEKMLMGFILGYKSCSIDEHIKDTREFVKLIDNWAVCDCVCSTLKFTKKHKAEMLEFLQGYKNGSEYEVRFFIVMLMTYFFDDDYIDASIELLLSINRAEYYINMALAWAFSIAFIKHEDKIMPIYEEKKLPVFVHNNAIQKTCDSFRVSQDTKAYIKTLKINHHS